jgi:hypothetical protein
MTSASPAIRLSADGITYGAPGVKMSFSPGATVYAKLDSTGGVDSTTWEVITTDDTTQVTDFTLTSSGIVSSVVTFTAGGAGTAGILQSTISALQDKVTGTVNPLTTQATIKWFVPAANGGEVPCFDEHAESGPQWWMPLLAWAIRGAVSGAGLPLTATLTTTDATPSIIASVPVPTNSIISVSYKVTAYAADGTVVVAERRIDAKRAGGSYVGMSPQVINVDVNTTGTAPSTVTGTADITAGALYGGGGTLDGLTLIGDSGAGPLTLTLSGAGNAASEAALVAAIAVRWPAWTVQLAGPGANKLVLSDATHGHAIIIGAGTANAALGLTAATNVGVAPALPDPSPGASTTVLQLRVQGVPATTIHWTMAYTVQSTS